MLRPSAGWMGVTAVFSYTHSLFLSVLCIFVSPEAYYSRHLRSPPWEQRVLMALHASQRLLRMLVVSRRGHRLREHSSRVNDPQLDTDRKYAGLHVADTSCKYIMSLFGIHKQNCFLHAGTSVSEHTHRHF